MNTDKIHHKGTKDTKKIVIIVGASHWLAFCGNGFPPAIIEDRVSSIKDLEYNPRIKT